MRQSLLKIRIKILETLSNPWALALVIFLGIVILLDLSPVGGNYRMYTAWVRCGQKPVAAYDAFGDKFFYDPEFYNPFQIIQPEKYFCTPEEAEVAGYEPPILFREDNLEQVDKQRYAP